MHMEVRRLQVFMPENVEYLWTVCCIAFLPNFCPPFYNQKFSVLYTWKEYKIKSEKWGLHENVCQLKEKGNSNLEDNYWDSFWECKTGVRHTLYWKQILEKQSITI